MQYSVKIRYCMLYLDTYR